MAFWRGVRHLETRTRNAEFFHVRVAANTHFNGYLLTYLVSIVKQPEGSDLGRVGATYLHEAPRKFATFQLADTSPYLWI